MKHPVALKCAAHTAECERKFLEADERLAAWGPALMEMLSTSRDAIARSRHLLGVLNDGNNKPIFATGPFPT